jgi:predicted esterase
MKILCLHGYGTSGEIFAEQLSSLIATLGEHHTFVFPDGEVPVTRSGMCCGRENNLAVAEMRIDC